MKYWYKLEESTDGLNRLREKGITKGKEVGFDFEKIGMSIKPGCTTYIAAAPASGKSEFWFEILMNLSCLYGWKHLVFSPETGNVEEIYAELCFKYIGKPYFSTIEGHMSESEKTRAEYFISQHFIVIDPKDNTLTVNQFYELADKIEEELGWTFNTTTIDPFNELEWDGKGLSRDLVIEKQLGDCRRNARKTGRHNCLITHVRDQVLLEKEGQWYNPMPTARDYSGGQAWFRKGEQMIILWRPPFGVTRESGEGVYEGNEVIVKVAKEKPKGASIKGEYTFFYDKKRNAYYRKENHEMIYAKRDLQLEQKKIKIEEPKQDDFYSNRTLQSSRLTNEEHNEKFKDFYDEDLPI
jgi:hypothetical protein